MPQCAICLKNAPEGTTCTNRHGTEFFFCYSCGTPPLDRVCGVCGKTIPFGDECTGDVHPHLCWDCWLRVYPEQPYHGSGVPS